LEDYEQFDGGLEVQDFTMTVANPAQLEWLDCLIDRAEDISEWDGPQTTPSDLRAIRSIVSKLRKAQRNLTVDA
jgi:hypothetical protein